MKNIFISLLVIYHTLSQLAAHPSVQKIITPKKITAYFVQLGNTKIVTIKFGLRKFGSIYHKNGALDLLSSCMIKCNGKNITGAEYENSATENGFAFDVSQSFDNILFSLVYINGTEEIVSKHIKEKLFNLNFDNFEDVKTIDANLCETTYNLPDNAIQRIASTIMFPNHKYSYYLKPDDIKKLKVGDIKNIYSNLFNKNNLRIVISGNLTKKQAAQVIDSIFGNIPLHSTIKKNPVDNIEAQKLRDTKIVKLGNSGYYRIAFYKDCDLIEPQTLKSILIQKMAMLFVKKMQLLNALRDHGLVYYLTLNMQKMDYSSFLYGITASKNLAETKKQTLKFIQKYNNSAMSKKEFMQNKSYLKSTLINNLNKSSDYAELVFMFLMSDIDVTDLFNRYIKELEKIDISEVNNFIKSNFEPSEFSFVALD